MGSRGRNRKGLYVAVLFILELQYELERRSKGDVPANWHPSPRNRPNHFCYWVIDAVATLNGPQARNFGELLETMEELRLTHVARMLHYTVCRRLELDGPLLGELDLETVLQRLGSPHSNGERHPQARKFARIVSEHLDADWREAVVSTAQEYQDLEGLSSMALLLGSLPPSFDALNRRIFSSLDDSELIREHRMLTVLQFYGLVTGTLPPAPGPWQRALSELANCDRRQLEILAALTPSQARELRRLGGTGWCLSLLRRRLHLSPGQWTTLGNELRSNSDVRFSLGSTVANRLDSLVHRGYIASWSALRLFAQSDAWETAGNLDEEIVRMMARGELGHGLVNRIAGWTDATWEEVSELLARHRDWAIAYLEDCATINELYSARTGARLGLRQLFPKTCAWLDGYLTEHMEDALIGDVGEVETLASLVSLRIRERLWLPASAVLSA